MQPGFCGLETAAKTGAGAHAAVLRRASCRLSAGLASRTIRAHMSDPTPEPPETDKPKPPSSPEEVTRKLEDFIKNTLGGQVLFTRVEGPAHDRRRTAMKKPRASLRRTMARPLSSITSRRTSRRTSTAS
jgi:hypothetical protein